MNFTNYLRVIGLLIIAIVIKISKGILQKRAKKIESLSHTISYKYTRKNDTILSRLDYTRLLSEGGKRKALNALEKTARNYKVILCDYYASNMVLANIRKSYRQTIICYLSKDLELPRFTIESETFFLKYIDNFNKDKKIEFDTNPKFSKRFYLTGKDKTAIKSIFTTDILNSFETITDKKLCVESTGNMLVFFKLNKCIPVHYIPMELEKTEKMYNLFSKRILF